MIKTGPLARSSRRAEQKRGLLVFLELFGVERSCGRPVARLFLIKVPKPNHRNLLIRILCLLPIGPGFGERHTEASGRARPPFAARGVSQRGGLSRRGSESAARVRPVVEALWPSREPVRRQAQISRKWKRRFNSGGVERGKQISEVGIERHRFPAIRRIPGSYPKGARAAAQLEWTARKHDRRTHRPRGEESVSSSRFLCVRARSRANSTLSRGSSGLPASAEERRRRIEVRPHRLKRARSATTAAGNGDERGSGRAGRRSRRRRDPRR